MRQFELHCLHLLLSTASTKYPSPHISQVALLADTYFPVVHERQLVADPEHVAQLESQLLQLGPSIKVAAGEPQDPQILVVVFRYVPAKQVSQLVDVPEQVSQLELQG